MPLETKCKKLGFVAVWCFSMRVAYPATENVFHIFHSFCKLSWKISQKDPIFHVPLLLLSPRLKCNSPFNHVCDMLIQKSFLLLVVRPEQNMNERNVYERFKISVKFFMKFQETRNLSIWNGHRQTYITIQ